MQTNFNHQIFFTSISNPLQNNHIHCSHNLQENGCQAFSLTVEISHPTCVEQDFGTITKSRLLQSLVSDFPFLPTGIGFTTKSKSKIC